MGHCESLSMTSSNKFNQSQDNLNSGTLNRKQTHRSQGSQAFTTCSSNMSGLDCLSGRREPHVYHCNHNSYSISVEELKSCQLLPCKCPKRIDVSIKILEAEAFDNSAKASICLKHGILYEVYCFECELKLCSKCNECFHNEYFLNHHLFLLQ